MLCWLPAKAYPGQFGDFNYPNLKNNGQLWYQIIPLNSVYYSFTNQKVFLQSFFNILMTIPLTMLFAIAFPKYENLKNALLLAFTVSFVIELGQGILDITLQLNRIVDIDDLIFNTIGGLLGFLLFKLIKKGMTKSTEHTC
ncbi:VanZ family protein [Enterococcus sp. MMGLQ5-2]|nr:VanZ family protein [Enterococcus sp. MMGLQ5-2]MBS7583225.1 VanZ family protein [Enterococcus sp. MMGLQ5-1]NPD11085.1 VanZ family protein [Enterococcus sp. MMGLQ5-1]NPD35828.1 VanZ family protein [Enterococcus sp. MMGLQ5-2]